MKEAVGPGLSGRKRLGHHLKWRFPSWSPSPLASVQFPHPAASQRLCWSCWNWVTALSSGFTSGLCSCGRSRVRVWRQLGCPTAGTHRGWGTDTPTAPLRRATSQTYRHLGFFFFSPVFVTARLKLCCRFAVRSGCALEVSERKPAGLPSPSSRLRPRSLALSRGVVAH